MDWQTTVSTVERLLNLIPGVEVVWVRESPNQARIGMAVRSQESLACLAHMGDAANIVLQIETEERQRRRGEKANPDMLRYVLCFPQEPEPAEPPSRLQVIGIFLARELKARKLLDGEEANRLQSAWNAVPI